MNKAKEIIEESGVAILEMRIPGHVGAAYTIGLTQLGAPELYCVLPPNDAEVVERMMNDLNSIAALIRKDPSVVRSGIRWLPEKEVSYAVSLMKPEEPITLTEVKNLYPLGYQVLEMVYEPI